MKELEKDNPIELKNEPDEKVLELVGTTIDKKYEVLSFIGQGGMSTVYKVRNKLLNEIMALKLMKSSGSNPKVLERFKQEAKAISKLAHPNLITYRDFGLTDSGELYLVVDYLEGSTLTEYIEKTDGLQLPRVVDVFEQLCNALSAAHNANIIHRDIKPENIMFLSADQEHQLKLVDFGIAKISSDENNESLHLTQTGEIFGSPLYMSPEQVQGQRVDARTDVYSLGGVIYTAMTGQPALAGESLFETMNNAVNKIPKAPTKLRPDLARQERAGWVNINDLEYVVLRCLEKDPSNRYQSIEEILMDLRKLRAQTPLSKVSLAHSSNVSNLKSIESVPGMPKPSLLNGQLITLLAGLLVIAIGAAAGYMLFRKPPEKPASTVAPASKTVPAEKTADQKEPDQKQKKKITKEPPAKKPPAKKKVARKPRKKAPARKSKARKPPAQRTAQPAGASDRVSAEEYKKAVRRARQYQQLYARQQRRAQRIRQLKQYRRSKQTSSTGSESPKPYSQQNRRTTQQQQQHRPPPKLWGQRHPPHPPPHPPPGGFPPHPPGGFPPR